MSKFKVGDRVRTLYDGVAGAKDLPIHSQGIVADVDDDSVCVDFGDWSYGHDGDFGDDTKKSYWFVEDKNLELVIDDKLDSHYNTRIQPIETMQANMTPEEFQGFCKGNIIKYACRCGKKDAPLKEAEKILRYAEWLVLSLKGEIINPHGEGGGTCSGS